MSQQIYLLSVVNTRFLRSSTLTRCKCLAGNSVFSLNSQRAGLRAPRQSFISVSIHGSSLELRRDLEHVGPLSVKDSRYRYVAKIRQKNTHQSLDKGWIETIAKDNPSGNQYRLRHHLCDPEDVPVDRDSKPLKFAVPRGAGGPLERCFDGEISWKAALVWISLKLRSNWKATPTPQGQTEKATLLELSKRYRIKLETFHKIITDLTHAGMLERLSPEIPSSDLSVVPQALPATCPVQPRDP